MVIPTQDHLYRTTAKGPNKDSGTGRGTWDGRAMGDVSFGARGFPQQEWGRDHGVWSWWKRILGTPALDSGCIGPRYQTLCAAVYAYATLFTHVPPIIHVVTLADLRCQTSLSFVIAIMAVPEGDSSKVTLAYCNGECIVKSL
jgi:hypothetical protein